MRGSLRHLERPRGLAAFAGLFRTGELAGFVATRQQDRARAAPTSIDRAGVGAAGRRKGRGNLSKLRGKFRQFLPRRMPLQLVRGWDQPGNLTGTRDLLAAGIQDLLAGGEVATVATKKKE